MGEAGVDAWADGPNGSKIDAKDCAFARATMGKAGFQGTFYGGEVEGPSAAAGAYGGSGSYGMSSEASLGRVEGNVGFVAARIEPNVNTGVGIRDETVEANFLGFGFQIGRRGLGINTPLGGLNPFG